MHNNKGGSSLDQREQTWLTDGDEGQLVRREVRGHLTGSLGTVRGTGTLLHLSLEDREQDTQDEVYQVLHTFLDIHIHTWIYMWH